MSETKIQWTERTWNPIAGCSVVSPGCTNCYAMRRVAPRLAANPATPHYHGTVKASKAGQEATSAKGASGKRNYVWTGRINIAGDDKFLEPMRIRKPAMWFVNSTSDLFHENVPDAVIDCVFAIMALCPQHTFQVLTKRSKRMRKYFADNFESRGQFDRVVEHMVSDPLLQTRPYASIKDACEAHGMPWTQPRSARDWYPLPNVWLGVSVEDQPRADERIPDLLATPAAIRFISAEPLLGPVDLTCIPRPGGWPVPIDDISDGMDALRFRGAATGGAALASSPSTSASATPCLDWVIVGGESGSGARPMHPDWARQIRDQCASAGVPFFFKQWGEWCPGENAGPPARRTETGATLMSQRWFYNRITPRESESMHRDDEPDVYRASTKRAGRMLDGVEHNAMPAPHDLATGEIG